MRNWVLYGSIFLALVLAIGGRYLPMSFREKTAQLSHNVFSPMIRVTDEVSRYSSLIQQSFRTIDELEIDVKELKLNNAQLIAENNQLKHLKQENDRLMEMLDFKQKSNFKLLAARVIQREISSWWNVVIINRGYEDDARLGPNQAVVTPRGIVGKTTTVGPYTTRVLLMMDENFKISAVAESSRSQGIVVGDTRGSTTEPRCRMTFVARNIDLFIGERVFSTGLGELFPANLLIGTINTVENANPNKDYGLFKNAYIKPAVDLNDLDDVFVIIGEKK